MAKSTNIAQKFEFNQEPSAQDKQKNTPLPLILRIGVTGHRTEPSNLPITKRKRSAPNIPAIRLTIQKVLEIISVSFDYEANPNKDLCNTEKVKFNQHYRATLQITSALASGTDQWAVEEALKLGFDLHAVLPFNKEEYLKDFSIPVEANTYRRLLSKANIIIELNGKVAINERGIRNPSKESYEAVGRNILAQIDLLIAVWDGKESLGLGGTGQVVKEALQDGIPVIWIPWNNPENWKIIGNTGILYDELHGDNTQISKILQSILNFKTDNNLNNCLLD